MSEALALQTTDILIEIGVFWHVTSSWLDQSFTQALPNQLQDNVSIVSRGT